MRELTRHLHVYLLAAVVLSACSSSSNPSTGGGGASAPTTPPAATKPPAAPGGSAQGQTITMSDAYQFQPATLTVPRGTTVTWMNAGQQPHTVTDDPAKASNRADAQLPTGAQPWDSGFIDAGKTFTHTFDTPGQYTYFCMPHEALGMVGHITVSG